MAQLRWSQAEAIRAGIMGGVDRAMKGRFDAYRLTGGRPPEFDAAGIPPDLRLDPNRSRLAAWRHWKSGLNTVVDGMQIIGALDDLLIDAAGCLAPLDGKSKGDEPKDDGAQYYQTQLDVYALLLQENGLAYRPEGWLIYYWPVVSASAESVMGFAAKAYRLTADPDRAVETIRNAMACLAGPVPPATGGCELCAYVTARGGA